MHLGSFIKKAYLLVPLSLSLGLSSCSQIRHKYTASVDLQHCTIKDGRLNNSDYELGEVLRFDRKTKRLMEVGKLPITAQHVRRIPGSGSKTADSWSCLSATDITLSGPSGNAIKELNTAQLTAGVAACFKCDVTNYHHEEVAPQGADAMINDPDLIGWRIAHKDALVSDGKISFLDNPDYLYVVVNKATNTDKLEITTGAPDDANGKTGTSLKTSLTLFNTEIVNVSYKNKSTATRQGQALPDVVHYGLYFLKPSPETQTSGAGIKFVNSSSQVSDADFIQLEADFAQALRNKRYY